VFLFDFAAAWLLERSAMAETSAQRKRRLDIEAQDVRVAKKRAKKDEAAAIKRLAAIERVKATALAIYLLAEQNLGPTLTYLRNVGRQHHWDDGDLEDAALTNFVTTSFKQASDDEVWKLLDPALTSFPKELTKAQTIVHAWRTTKWVERQNINSGQKPPSTILHMQAEKKRLLIAEAMRPRSWGVPGQPRSRQILHRLRLKYQGRFGQLPCAPDLSAADMRAKAAAAWQWYNYYAANVPHGKQTLRINWDETAICLDQCSKKGNIFVCRGHNAVQHVSQAARRAYMTHVALVCDNPMIQPFLPQVIICNMQTLPAKMHAALQARLGDNFVLLRQAKAWVNADTSVQIMRMIADALEPFRGEWQPLLMLDAYRAHITLRVFNAGVRHRIWILIIPAGMTWLLQVLDTHGFRSYKNCLRDAYQLHWIRQDEQGADINNLQLVLDSVRDATTVDLNGKEWAYAFVRNGFGVLQGGVRPRIRTTLALDDSFSVTSQRPLPAQVRLCLPRNAAMFYNAIWRAMEVGASAARVISAPSCTISEHSSSSSSQAPIASRTRAKAKAASHLGGMCG